MKQQDDAMKHEDDCNYPPKGRCKKHPGGGGGCQKSMALGRDSLPPPIFSQYVTSPPLS